MNLARAANLNFASFRRARRFGAMSLAIVAVALIGSDAAHAQVARYNLLVT